jgi:hypothetical protein
MRERRSRISSGYKDATHKLSLSAENVRFGAYFGLMTNLA